MDLKDFAAEIDRYTRILGNLEAKPESEEKARKLATLGHRTLGLIRDMSKIAWTAKGRAGMVEIRDRAYTLCGRVEALGFARVGDPQAIYTRDAGGALAYAGRMG